ncbi:PREDICTED: uncharacterized protein LOC109147540 [Ipomoea nil]|uniref:uncharacterized protein LOC109147540 n=1 Tax=Ipomoea nil TaxID=35883 RepID=UPI000900E5B3|nr:PREDICTED: uncharacterized protein LOC109147540 [Ipomoea nil]
MSAYNLIACQSKDEIDYGWVWRARCVEKVLLFFWKITKNGVFVNEDRKRSGLTQDDGCLRCGKGVETLDHLFRRCEMAIDNWNQWPTSAGFNVLAHVVVRRARKETDEAQQVLLKQQGHRSGRQVWVSWSPPEQGFVKLNTDGAKKKTSSCMASAGGVICDHNGEWIVGFISKVGITNSFIAKLWGLREGLLLARS